MIDFAADLRASTPTSAAEIATPVLSDLKENIKYCESTLIKAMQDFLNNKTQSLDYLQKSMLHPSNIVRKCLEKINSADLKIRLLINNIFSNKKNRINEINFSSSEKKYKINEFNHKLETLTNSLKSRIEIIIYNHNIKLENFAKLLKLTHYDKILKRGFSIIKNQKNEIISSINQIKQKEEISIVMNDGEFSSYVLFRKPNIIKSNDIDLFNDKNS